MRHFRILLYIILFSRFITGYSQSSIIVTPRNSTEDILSIYEIDKITFSSKTMIIEKTNSTLHGYLYPDLLHLKFDNYISGIAAEEYEVGDPISLYPNPVSEQLNIRCSSNTTLNGNITILDITGRVVIKEDIRDTFVSINVHHLKKGIYYSLIQNQDKTTAIQFIKN